MVARHCIVKGHVQGVGFRFFTSRIAQECDIKGWVKNLPNGDVEIYAIGDNGAMDTFMRKIEEGPSWAIVEHITSRDVEPEPCSNFLIEE